MLNVENLIIPFLSGGLLVAAIKYTASVIKDTSIAAAIGSFPIGLFSIYFLTSEQAYSYSINYSKMLVILLFSSLVFTILYNYLLVSKNVAYILAIISWLIMTIIKIKLKL